MTPDQFEHAAEECTKALEEFANFVKKDVRSNDALGFLKEIVALAKAAIPSGQVAEDVELVRAVMGVKEIRPMKYEADALQRLANQAQSAEVWRKRVEAASDALADVLPGEVGRLDLLARIGALKAALEQEKDLHRRTMGELDSAHNECETLREQVARLSAAGQVLSAHVDKTAGAPLGPYEMARNALGGDLAKLPNIEPGAAETEDCGHEAEVERLRAVLGNIATACEAKDLRLYAPSKQALDAQRKVIENVWRWATAAAGGEVVQSEHVDKAPTITTEEWTAMGEDSEPGTSVPRGSPPEWTMRDEFAKAALQGILANPTTQEKPDICAKAAYIAADAMIAARGNAPEPEKAQNEAPGAKCYAPKHINCPCGWDPPQTCHYPTPDGEPTEAAWKEAHELHKVYQGGVEAMRAACLEAVRQCLEQHVCGDDLMMERLKAAIEGASL